MKKTILTSGTPNWRRWLMLFVLACTISACADDDGNGKYGFHSKHRHGKQPPTWYRVPDRQPAN
ncbi:hypothetical protein [Acetobacter aceti]|uniref:Lipoprotein n=1 Tax=Acetobacter aceti TaxID=435 RepID=A0A6S6PJU2_ACEAC|nr:hypothetical protein [Acetobacter aceti]BCI67250.1 hypothetical protein AAJCM20276_18740 [Acetobacter aceti]